MTVFVAFQQSNNFEKPRFSSANAAYRGYEMASNGINLLLKNT